MSLPNPERISPNEQLRSLIERALERPDVQHHEYIHQQTGEHSGIDDTLQLPLDDSKVLITRNHNLSYKDETTLHVRVPGAIGLEAEIYRDSEHPGFVDVQMRENGAINAHNVVTRDGENTFPLEDPKELSDVVALAISTMGRALEANPVKAQTLERPQRHRVGAWLGKLFGRNR